MCKSCLLFYNKNLLFLFYTINLLKHPHQIIYNTPSFIKIILFHIFYYYFPYPYTAPPPYLTSLKHSFSFFFSILFLLASFFFFFFISLKKKIYLPSFHGSTHSHSLSLMAVASLGFGLIYILPNGFFVVFYFELILSWVCDDFH